MCLERESKKKKKLFRSLIWSFRGPELVVLEKCFKRELKTKQTNKKNIKLQSKITSVIYLKA